MKIQRIEVVKATQELVNQLKGRYRESDKEECYAASGKVIEDAAQEGFEQSELCWVGLVDEKPFCIFGVGKYIENIGIPWMLATDDIRYASEDLKYKSKIYIDKMLDRFDFLMNFVDARNIIAVKWLAKCGFQLNDAKKYGFEGKPFHRFWLKKGGSNV